MTERTEWQSRARYCPETEDGKGFHNLIPISWSVTVHSKSVNILMCTQCLHHINTKEAWAERATI